MSDSENQGAKHVDGKWEISLEPEPWDAYFYIGYEHGDTRAPMGLQEGLKYFNALEADIIALKAQLEAAEGKLQEIATPKTRATDEGSTICLRCGMETFHEKSGDVQHERDCVQVEAAIFLEDLALSAPSSDTGGEHKYRPSSDLAESPCALCRQRPDEHDGLGSEESWNND